jgi:hypothetical protein
MYGVGVVMENDANDPAESQCRRRNCYGVHGWHEETMAAVVPLNDDANGEKSGLRTLIILFQWPIHLSLLLIGMQDTMSIMSVV